GTADTGVARKPCPPVLPEKDPTIRPGRADQAAGLAANRAGPAFPCYFRIAGKKSPAAEQNPILSTASGIFWTRSKEKLFPAERSGRERAGKPRASWNCCDFRSYHSDLDTTYSTYIRRTRGA